MRTSEGQRSWDGLEKTREAILKWFGHVRRAYGGKMMGILGEGY